MNKPLGGHVHGYMGSQELVSQYNDQVRMPNNVMKGGQKTSSLRFYLLSFLSFLSARKS